MPPLPITPLLPILVSAGERMARICMLSSRALRAAMLLPRGHWRVTVAAQGRQDGHADRSAGAGMGTAGTGRPGVHSNSRWRIAHGSNIRARSRSGPSLGRPYCSTVLPARQPWMEQNGYRTGARCPAPVTSESRPRIVGPRNDLTVQIRTVAACSPIARPRSMSAISDAPPARRNSKLRCARVLWV